MTKCEKFLIWELGLIAVIDKNDIEIVIEVARTIK